MNARPILMTLLLALILQTYVAAQSALQPVDEIESDWNVAVATDATWPPMEYVNRDGELVGFDIDLVREIGRRAGFRPQFITVPWDGIFIGLAARQYDMVASSVTLLEERRRHMRFSNPYLAAAQYLVVSDRHPAVTSLDQLVGGEVGAQIGTTGARLVDATPGVTVRSYDDLGHAVEDLAAGRLDGIVADIAIIEHYILANPRYRDTLRRVDRPYAVEPYALAIRLDLPDLHAAVHEALEQMRVDGTLQEIADFWYRYTAVQIPMSP